MKCPHCLIDFDAPTEGWELRQDADASWGVTQTTCTACQRVIVALGKGLRTGAYSSVPLWQPTEALVQVRPLGAARPVPSQVPEPIADDFREACAVLPISPKASAALSRRCLQALLRDQAGTKKNDLFDQIQEVHDSKALPYHLADDLDAVRNIGNFAAHAMKSQHTGEIMDVEPGEAEWNLDVLEGLFDFYFVAPARAKAKRDAMNEKLAEAGKPPIRTP